MRQRLFRVSLVIAIALAAIAGSAQATDLTAGDIDDHLNFEEFLDYQADALARDSTLPALSFGDRITVRLVDAFARSFGIAYVTVQPGQGGGPMAAVYSGADGVARLFPASDGLPGGALRLEVRREPAGPVLASATVDPSLSDEVTIPVPGSGVAPTALDLLLVLDTTGSMADEIAYLTAGFDAIVTAVGEDHPEVTVRLGLVAYRDMGDEYVVQSHDFTASLSEMLDWLGRLRAGGGGDYPEAMDQALEAARELSWRQGPVARLLVLIADAPPHANRYNATVDAVRALRNEGIRVHPLAASGVGAAAEYVLRSSAVLTHGRYMFLTDDSGLGNSHAEPSVPCYLVTSLDSLIARVVGSDLSGERIEPDDSEILRTVGDYEKGVCLSSDPAGGGGSGLPSDSGPSDLALDGLSEDTWTIPLVPGPEERGGLKPFTGPGADGGTDATLNGGAGSRAKGWTGAAGGLAVAILAGLAVLAFVRRSRRS